MKPARVVASFDSATGMLRALSRFLAGRDTPLIGQLPGALEPVMSVGLGAVNHAPRWLAERVYAASGVTEAIPRDKISEVRSESLASWVVEHYPRQRYPVIFVGASNGALVHLAAALGAAWLPQTLLIPVRRTGVDRDDAVGEMHAGLEPGGALLEANPDLALHHMHDPNQDRLMVAGMSYFRIKWRRLPNAYRQFIRNHLDTDGLLVAADCALTWPTTRVGARHVFQFGALGGASSAEYSRGGPRVEDWLRRVGSRRQRWDPPDADDSSPEAEWGFDTALLADLRQVTELGHHRLQRLRFDHPEQLSAPVADLYRRCYADRGLPRGKLLAECFLLLEPWWTLRTASVPFWMPFNTEGSLGALRDYLDDVEPFDEIRLMLFSHGVRSIGLAEIPQWEEILQRARKVGSFLGVDRHAYPRDFATLARAHRDLSHVRNRFEIPLPIEPGPAREMLHGYPGVRWDAR